MSMEKLFKTLNDKMNLISNTETEKKPNSEGKDVPSVFSDVSEANIFKALDMITDINKLLDFNTKQLLSIYKMHFPELKNIISGFDLFVAIVNVIGHRGNIRYVTEESVTSLISLDTLNDIKHLAAKSAGQDITDIEVDVIETASSRILYLNQSKKQMNEILRTQMLAIAPVMTILIGELIAAKLIKLSGSLVELAFTPASRIQLLGSKSNRGIVGVLINASYVKAAPYRIRPKVIRTLAAKVALAARHDAYSTEPYAMNAQFGNKLIGKVKQMLRGLDENYDLDLLDNPEDVIIVGESGTGSSSDTF